MDIQTILIILLVLLTVNLVAVCIYVILILKEFRQTVKKANLVLDNIHNVTDAVANPITSLAGIIAGVTKSVAAVRAISSLIDNKDEDE